MSTPKTRRAQEGSRVNLSAGSTAQILQFSKAGLAKLEALVKAGPYVPKPPTPAQLLKFPPSKTDLALGAAIRGEPFPPGERRYQYFEGRLLLTAATAYATDGIPVFPCKPDKTPHTTHGHKDATTDLKKIERWWKRWPDALIGAPTGLLFDVLDLDEKNGHHGLQQVPDWKTRSNVISRTGSGGAHLFFKASNIRNSTGKIADGVDTRGAGGYVILPPSPGYSWVKGDLLHDLGKLNDWPNILRPSSATTPQQSDKGKALRRAARNLNEPMTRNECKAALKAVPADCDYDTWFQIGCVLYHERGDEEGFELWDTWSQTAPDKYAQEGLNRTDLKWAECEKRKEDYGAGTLVHYANQYNENWRDNVVEDDEPEFTPTKEKIEPVDLWGNFEAPPLPRGLLPKLIEDYAFTLGDTMGADPAGIAMSALTVCAASIHDDIKLQMKQHVFTWREAARVWCALVGPPSAMKSPSMLEPAKPIKERDRELLNTYLHAKAVYDEMDKEERRANGITKPVQKRLCLEDVTIESAQDILGSSPSGVLLYQDELSGFFGAMDKYSGSRGGAKDRGFWLQSWNGGSSGWNRVGRGAGMIPNLSTCLLGGIQPDVIRLLTKESYDDGFLQRTFLIMLRPAVIGKDIPTPNIVEKYDELVKKLLGLQRAVITIGDNTPYYYGDDPADLRFNRGAQELREKLERRHLELSQLESINKKLASHIGKYNGYFGRLCVLWHCVEHAFDERLPTTVTLDTAQRVAHFLHDFLLPHAFAFYSGVLGLSDEHDRIANVASYILAHKLETVTHRDVQRGDHTMRKLERQDTEKVFEQLEALGWVTPVLSKRGRAMHWDVNPEVHVRFAERAKHEAERRATDHALILRKLGKI